MLDIKPLHDDSRQCLEDIAASVAAWWGLGGIEMTYAESWGFEFEKNSSGDYKLFADRIFVNRDDLDRSARLLEQYHGIKTYYHDTKTIDEVLALIGKCLANNCPVVISIQSFWCPWHVNFYQKVYDKNMHYCLVVGIDDAKEFLYCIDPIKSTNVEKLKVREFSNGCGYCFTFEKIGPEKTDIDWRNIVAGALTHARGESNGESIFKALRDFADEFERSFDLVLETRGFEKAPNKAPLFWDLELIGRGRRRFGRLLEFFATRYDAAYLLPVAERLAKAGERWTMLRFMLDKACQLNEPGPQLKKIVGKIREAADDEESIAEFLSDVLKSRPSS